MKKLLLTLALGVLVGQQIFAAEAEEGFKSMFDGKDLAGWAGSPDLWSVKDGALTGQTTEEHPAKENTFLIYTNSQPGDFEMRCSFKIAANNAEGFANSGIQYRSKIVKRGKNTYKPVAVVEGPGGSVSVADGFGYWVIFGYQADMEAGPTYSGILYEEKARGILATRGEKVVIHADGKKEVVGSVGKSEDIQASLKKEDWNDYVIIAKGNHLQQFINGHQTIDLVDEQESAAAKAGVIALQLHAHKNGSMTVQFKDLRIKDLK